ncbi:Protein tipE [Orchesella cincta]|uniref:Protein tipE n=1 Tax=Orchesella cincta TaxID=48709 RepID=A0A1D2NKE1_ORCCI|nr:Protein tipE [Orchesella cincta]
MRFPEGDKSASINNNSGDDSFVRFPSTSSTSQELDDERTTSNTNIATISEHVLFENNDGRNGFLYLYYSSTNNPGFNSQRPYTTGGGGGVKGAGAKWKMDSGSGGQQKWNDLSGLRSISGSAGPSPMPFPADDEEGYKYDKQKMSDFNKKPSGTTGATPYPVYLPPGDGNDDDDDDDVGNTMLFPSESPEKSNDRRGRGDEEERTGRGRLDSFTADLLDDDWEKIYGVPNVDSRYLLSPSPGSRSRAVNVNPNKSGRFPRQSTSKESNSLNVSKISLASSASSSSRAHLIYNETSGNNKNSSLKRVRITPDTKGSGYPSSKKLSSRSSSRSNRKLSPVSSSIISSSSVRKKHGVTSHHHQPPPNSMSNGNGNVKRVSNTTLDQMSFKNGIGAYFGTEASRRHLQNPELTPEEMYHQEMQGWRSRLATAATIFTATLFILSCSSLLFVFPILVDPILVGFEAQFSNQPVICRICWLYMTSAVSFRTTNFRNGSGPSECAIPSCREGCTLDLFSCIFVEVEYTIDNDTYFLSDNSSFSATHEQHTSSSSQENLMTQDYRRRSATLLINVNGCGYPPRVSCSEFEKEYAPLNTEFPCYYSRQNESIVVPHYSRRREIIYLTMGISIPVGLALFSAISLYLLLRYQVALKAEIYRKYALRKKAIKDGEKPGEEDQEEKDVEVEGSINEDELTSLSEIDLGPDEDDYQGRNHKTQNGYSKTGIESRLVVFRTIKSSNL